MKALVNPQDIVYLYIAVKIPAGVDVEFVKKQRKEMVKKAQEAYPTDITVIKWPLEFRWTKDIQTNGYVAEIGIRYVDADKLQDLEEEDEPTS